MIAVAEISGADSIAAVLRYAEEHPGTRFVPTYVHTGTEFGDFARILANVEFLRRELPGRGGSLETDLIEVSDPSLWRALAGRPARALAELFGTYLPCVPCHLYLHLMRIPVAREFDSHVVVSGEREHHGTRTKANQTAEALDTYVEVLALVGIELALPLRSLADARAVSDILGPRWQGGSPQLECVLSGNETGVDGSCVASLPEDFVAAYLRPVGLAIAKRLISGSDAWDEAVAQVLQRAADDRRR